MHVTDELPGRPSDQVDPVDAVRLAIWRLFQEGYVDEDMATAGLLALDVGTRRTRSNALARPADRAMTNRRKH